MMPPRSTNVHYLRMKCCVWPTTVTGVGKGVALQVDRLGCRSMDTMCYCCCCCCCCCCFLTPYSLCCDRDRDRSWFWPGGRAGIAARNSLHGDPRREGGAAGGCPAQGHEQAHPGGKNDAVLLVSMYVHSVTTIRWRSHVTFFFSSIALVRRSSLAVYSEAFSSF